MSIVAHISFQKRDHRSDLTVTFAQIKIDQPKGELFDHHWRFQFQE